MVRLSCRIVSLTFLLSFLLVASLATAAQTSAVRQRPRQAEDAPATKQPAKQTAKQPPKSATEQTARLRDEVRNLQQAITRLKNQAQEPPGRIDKPRTGQAVPKPHGPREQVARRLEQLHDTLAEATRAGKKELADRVRQEIREYAKEAATETLKSARKNTEDMLKKRMEFMERFQMHLPNPEEQARSADIERKMKEAAKRAFEHAEEARMHAEKRLAEMGHTVEQMRREITQLRGRAQVEEVERARRDLEAEQAPHRKPPRSMGPDERAEHERRLHHLRIAADNLAAIGMHELVERLQNEAKEIESALQTPHAPAGDPHGGIMEAFQQQFQAINRRLDELSERVERLSRQHHPDR